MNNTKEDFFVMIPIRYREIFDELEDNELGQLIKTFFHYAEDGECEEIEDRAVSGIFKMLKREYMSRVRNYNDRCEKQSSKKKEWWDKKKAEEEELKNLQPKPKAAQPVKAKPISRTPKTEEKVVSKSIPEEIYDLYNEQYVPDLAPCVPQVKSQCVMRIASLMSEGWDKEAFVRLFDKAKASPFLKGDISDWQCNLLWLLNDKNYPKVLAGNYDKSTKAKKVEVKVQEPAFIDFEGWEIVGDHMEYAVYKGGVRTVKEIN